MRRLAQVVVVLAVMVAVALPTLAGEGKKAEKKKPVPQQFQIPKEITLTAEQRKQLDELIATYGPKLEAFQKQRDEVLSEEQRKSASEARKAGQTAGKTGKELQQAVDEAMKLTPEQKTKLDVIRKESAPLGKEIRLKVQEVLTPEQREVLKSLEEKKKETAKK